MFGNNRFQHGIRGIKCSTIAQSIQSSHTDAQPLPDGGILRINETRLARFDNHGFVRYEIKILPYLYDIATTNSNTLLVGADGNGTNCYAFDDASGSLIKHIAKSGSPHFSPCAGQWLAAFGNEGLLFVSPDGTCWTRVPCQSDFAVTGVVDPLIWSLPWIGDHDGLRLDLHYFEAK